MIPGARAAVVETILSNEKVAMERWRRGDPLGWVEIAAEEVSHADPTLLRPVRGLTAYREHLQTLVDEVRDCSGFIDPRVVVYGSAAVLSYNCVGGVAGRHRPVLSRRAWNCTHVYALVRGRWTIVHTHWSDVGQNPPDGTTVKPPENAVDVESDSVLTDLLCLDAIAMERWRQGDPCGFVDLCDRNVTYFDPETPRRVNGIDALRVEYANRGEWPLWDLIELAEPHVQFHGDAALLTYRRFAVNLKWDGSVASSSPWNCTEVFARGGDRWRIVHAHWSYILGEGC